MVFHKILSVLQIAFALVFVGFSFGWTDAGFATIAGLYFLFKGFTFFLMKGNVISLADAGSGIFILFAVFGVFSNVITSTLVVLFLLQKGVTYLLR